MIAAGRYSAKIKGYGIGTYKDGSPKVMILFSFKDADEKQQELTWAGSLKEGRAREITIDALLVCGLRGEDIKALAGGVETGLLSTENDVSIVIEHEEYEGKTYARIKWVNPAGGGAFKKSTIAEVQKMAGLDLKTDVLARRKETGISEDDNLPF